MSARKYIVKDYPELAKEYLKDKNEVPVEKIYRSYPDPVWWKCDKGHEYRAKVSDRVSGHGCIYCSNQVPIVGQNDLATRHPKLVEEWHPTKNGDLTPQMFLHGSNKKVWWKCKEGHEWQAAIYQRAAGNNCPYCSGRRPIRGENDLETMHSDIAMEWHPDKNGNLKPSEVKSKVNKKVWWKCKEGHEWEDRISDRVIYNKKCPFCNNKVVIPEKNSFKAVEPKAASYWDYAKNGDLKPENFSPYSSKVVYWTCGKHNWEEAIASMTKRKTCPYCSGARLSPENSAFNKHPGLLPEFDFEKNDGIDINTISEGSSKPIWWKCPKGHSWLASTERRVKGSGCPYCAGKRSIYSV